MLKNAAPGNRAQQSALFGRREQVRLNCAANYESLFRAKGRFSPAADFFNGIGSVQTFARSR